jgi:hypothetical protein
LEIAEVNYSKRELKVAGSNTPLPFDDVLFLTDPEHPNLNLTRYFATDNPALNEALVRLDRVKEMGGKPPQRATAAPEAKKKSKKKLRING